MTIRHRPLPIRLFLRASLLSACAATLTFVIVWMLRNPIDDISLIVPILLIPLLLLYGGMLPVNLLLLLCTVLLRSFAPGIAGSATAATILLALIGGAAAAGVVAVALGTLGLESAFVQVVMLGATIGGIVSGWVMAGNSTHTST